MIKKTIYIAALCSMTAFAAEEISLEDGRKILLQDDGTWSYSSSDRLLNSADGRQVRVRQDGTWEYSGQMAIIPNASGSENALVSIGDISLTLKQLAVETANSKNHKNNRKETQTVFLVRLANNAESAVKFELDKASLGVEDSGGREYPILQVEPAVVELQPGEQTLIEVRADGSPHWFTIKAMELYFYDGALPSEGEAVLKGLMADAKKRKL